MKEQVQSESYCLYQCHENGVLKSHFGMVNSSQGQTQIPENHCHHNYWFQSHILLPRSIMSRRQMGCPSPSHETTSSSSLTAASRPNTQDFPVGAWRQREQNSGMLARPKPTDAAEGRLYIHNFAPWKERRMETDWVTFMYLQDFIFIFKCNQCSP